MHLAQVTWEDPVPSSSSSSPRATARESTVIATEELTIRGSEQHASINSTLQSPRKEFREETRKPPSNTKHHPSWERSKKQGKENTEAPPPPPQQSPTKKRHQIHCRSEDKDTDHPKEERRQVVPNPIQTIATAADRASSLIGRIEKGQTSQILEDEVLGYKDMHVEAYEFSALLRHMN